MATKNRYQLKQKFLNGLTPDEDDFGDLIDGTINIADDDIVAKNGKIGIGTNDPSKAEGIV